MSIKVWWMSFQLLVGIMKINERGAQGEQRAVAGQGPQWASGSFHCDTWWVR